MKRPITLALTAAIAIGLVTAPKEFLASLATGTTLALIQTLIDEQP